MDQKMSITVKGRHKEWAFTFDGDPQHLDDWRADGLEVYEVLNSIPVWAQQIGLTHIWCWAQDAWRFLRVW